MAHPKAAVTTCGPTTGPGGWRSAAQDHDLLAAHKVGADHLSGPLSHERLHRPHPRPLPGQGGTRRAFLMPPGGLLPPGGGQLRSRAVCQGTGDPSNGGHEVRDPDPMARFEPALTPGTHRHYRHQRARRRPDRAYPLGRRPGLRLSHRCAKAMRWVAGPVQVPHDLHAAGQPADPRLDDQHPPHRRHHHLWLALASGLRDPGRRTPTASGVCHSSAGRPARSRDGRVHGRWPPGILEKGCLNLARL